MMRRISDEMDRLFDTFGMGRGMFPDERDQADFANYGARGEGAPAMWSPHVELRERNGKLVIEADLPGLKRDDINVRIEQDQVIIQGQRHQEQSSNQGSYYRSERRYGSFYRTIPLPDGADPDSASASFRDGVLEIELDQPRAQQRGRTLEIRDGSPGRKNG
jgi:HSP20 family protein